MNRVISGDYAGKKVVIVQNTPAIALGGSEYVLLTPKVVASHTQTYESGVKVNSNRLKCGVIGGLLFGSKGAAFGVLTGSKTKSAPDKYHVFVAFKNQENAVLEVDRKMYHRVIKSLAD